MKLAVIPNLSKKDARKYTLQSIDILHRLGAELFMHDEMQQEFAPVSYTHLDVYKRQFLTLPRNCCINATIRFMTCIIWLYVWPEISIRKPY